MSSTYEEQLKDAIDRANLIVKEMSNAPIKLIKASNADLDRAKVLMELASELIELNASEDILRTVFTKLQAIYHTHYFISRSPSDEDEQHFLTQLETITDLDERIEFLRTTDFDLSKYDSPSVITNYFEDIKYAHDPLGSSLRIAQVFKERLSDTVPDIDQTMSQDRFMTIMDYLDDRKHMTVNKWLIRSAFKKLGFKSARDYEDNADELIRLFNNVRDYNWSHYLFSPHYY